MNHFLGIWLCTEPNPQNFKLSRRDGQGSQKAIKKVPQNIDFVGLVFFLSPFGFSFGDPPGVH
ncbi:hypothetical protein [Bacteroides acidifaciens]|uniref:hypothetical protein n=1 Tax=Bacteroides acidifaciens TaxID=85831 RepID=UPI002584B291|nr:hypothetical protein [Bacteroides acidifaciens]